MRCTEWFINTYASVLDSNCDPGSYCNEHTASSMCAHRQSHRRSKRSCPSLEKLTAPSRYFTNRHNTITCLKIGLDSSNEAHRKVICAVCTRYIGSKIVLSDEFKNIPNNDGIGRRQCEQP